MIALILLQMVTKQMIVLNQDAVGSLLISLICCTLLALQYSATKQRPPTLKPFRFSTASLASKMSSQTMKAVPFLSPVFPLRICLIAPNLPKTSYISSLVILQGRLRTKMILLTSGARRMGFLSVLQLIRVFPLQINIKMKIVREKLDFIQIFMFNNRTKQAYTIEKLNKASTYELFMRREYIFSLKPAKMCHAELDKLENNLRSLEECGLKQDFTKIIACRRRQLFSKGITPENNNSNNIIFTFLSKIWKTSQQLISQKEAKQEKASYQLQQKVGQTNKKELSQPLLKKEASFDEASIKEHYE